MAGLAAQHPRGDRRSALAGGGLLLAAAAIVVPIASPSPAALLVVAVPAIGLAVGRRRLASRRSMEGLVERMETIVLDNQRLAAEASQATREVERSRTRIVASVERERRRIERDLHDGAQQRLVALRIELELAEKLVRQDPQRGAERLKELELEVDEALEELRALAHGVCPPLLADRGVAEALVAVAKRSPIPVEVETRGVGRYAPEVEGAVYFCVVEALQNVLKHAGARNVHVRVDADTRSALRFSVSDDGTGSLDGVITPGAGLTNMRDRVTAVGGELEIDSVVGVGTTVRGQVSTAPQLTG